VIFALVTTDPHKIPATIASRCQRFDFGRIPAQAVVDRLAVIAEKEGLTVESGVLPFIAHHSTGAMRDAISLLDQLASYGDEITLDQAKMLLGTVASEAAAKLVAKLVDGDLAGGLDLINRAVGDGADPRQFGTEVIEYLRGLLLIREGAGTRLLSATEEQAAVMEDLAQRISAERLLKAIRLFNEAATDLRHGLQTIPQLPLEMALVDSVLDPEARQLPAQAVRQGNVLYQTSQPAAQPANPQPETDVPQPVRQEGTDPSETPAAAEARSNEGKERVVQQEAAGQEPSAGALSLAQVEQAWETMIHAVWQRNPATAGALRSQCKPVEVTDDELVITFPYPFLKEKLVDPQRKAEIQDALAEVLKSDCRIKLLLASEYVPRRAANPSPRPASASTPQPQPNPAEEAHDARLDVEEVAQQLAPWAEELGGQITVVPPDNS
jgi:DNA polymerase-3 subunit gamma/tau